MTTENNISDNNEKDLKPLKENEILATENENSTTEIESSENSSKVSEPESLVSKENETEKLEAEISEETETLESSDLKKISDEKQFPKDEEIKSKEIVSNENEKNSTVEENDEDEKSKKDEIVSLPKLLDMMEKIINSKDGETHYKEFNHLKEKVHTLINSESEVAKRELPEDEQANYHHPISSRFNGILNIYREQQNEYHKKIELEQAENLKNRQSIIDRLKNLYTNSEVGTNLFKSIREIKEDWGNAGQVAKNEFKLLNNNYFFHLTQFYEMLDMNKEFLVQEYEHNLEKRQNIIARAKELLDEKSVQKALNELQYLHKLWKEEAVPVAEEFRETTWLEFKELSNKIHDRKTELFSQIDAEQAENLIKKNEIISKMKALVSPEKEGNHNYWQQSIKKIEDLRTEFLKLGSVPKKESNHNWSEFKEILRQFNSKKNDFYKGLKNSQQDNLDKKLSLIQTATDNMNSEDWETAVPLFKNLQNEWKKIGHVPRSQADKIWTEFRAACNTFFENFRQKNDVASDNWKENLKQKNQILAELKTISDEKGSVEKIEELKNNWNKVGKVPRENLGINTEFNKILKEKLKLNKINEFDLKEEGLTESQLSDKARKIKNQISDTESEIVKMENNLGFFADSSRNNPLLKETYLKIDEKKVQLESLKATLHQIISGE
ncbi:DUF349 domain-containing protein [Halpernia sp.]|uniref:DUF349 domain-containing protein n=1 Tax=Halpernia sp. TaxID=2782209 RepID=UPI003A91EB08